MMNKSVMAGKPFAVLGDFWQPILDRVREVELGHPGPWGEANAGWCTWQRRQTTVAIT